MARTSDHTRQQYNRVWGSRLEQINELAEKGCSLFELVCALNVPDNKNLYSSKRVSNVNSYLGEVEGIARTASGLPCHIVSTFMNRVMMAPNVMRGMHIMFDFLNMRCSEKTQYIIELGAGTGVNLAYSHFLLKDRFPDIRYVAAEWSEAGRECGRKLAEMDPAFPLDVLKYNYYEPDYSFIPEEADVIVCSNHSIEQIPLLPESVHTGVLERTKNVTFYHLEPVGWQWDEAAVSFYEELKDKEAEPLNPKDFIHQLDKKFDPRWAASYSFELDYNTNFRQRIEKLADEGRVEIETVILNEFGYNPRNPGTRIVARGIG